MQKITQIKPCQLKNLDEWRVNKHGLLGDVDDVLHLLKLGREVVEVAHVDHRGDLHLVERVGGHQGQVVLEGNERRTCKYKTKAGVQTENKCRAEVDSWNPLENQTQTTIYSHRIRKKPDITWVK